MHPGSLEGPFRPQLTLGQLVTQQQAASGTQVDEVGRREALVLPRTSFAELLVMVRWHGIREGTEQVVLSQYTT